MTDKADNYTLCLRLKGRGGDIFDLKTTPRRTTSMALKTIASKRPVFMVTHYEVLGLPSASSATGGLTPQLLKAAYRRALLQHHPDKVQLVITSRDDTIKAPHKQLSSIYTVDQITKAYSVISTPRLRTEYDRTLALQSVQTGSSEAREKNTFHTGVEIVDLDDLEFDDKESLWFRGCRCGDDRGFSIREEDLEEVVDDGELNVGCKGCSLWLRVLFGVVEGDAEEIPTKKSSND